MPLRPLEPDESAPFAEEPGDTFVIMRDLPQVDDPEEMAAVFGQYEHDLSELLTPSALDRIIDAETSLTAVRWVVRVPLEKPEDEVP